MMKASFFGILLLALAVGLSASSQRPAYDPTSPTGVNLPPEKITVDQECRILADLAAGAAKGVKPRWRRDSVVCHLESVHTSEHPEEKISGGMRQREHISISEQEYLLQDVTAGPVIFEVREFVPSQWQVDSDPQPVETVAFSGKNVGSAAVFRVNAQPGETVRLHVGLRDAKMGKPKVVKPAVQ